MQTTAPSTPSGRVYRRVWLPYMHEIGAAEMAPFLPGSQVEVPALSFGDTDFARPGLVEAVPQGAAGTVLRRGPVAAYLLRDAVVHGRFGVVTCGDMLVGESAAHLALHRIPGAAWLDETRLRLPERPAGGTLPAAFHLLACNLDNYFHWLLDGLSRFDAATLRGIGLFAAPGRDFRLLVPPLDTEWKRQSLGLLVPPDIACVAMPGEATVQVGRLLYVPEFAGGGWWGPHRALLAVFDRMRAVAYAAGPTGRAAPRRRLFVSRADSRNRPLVNEAEIAALAARAGFERVVLGEIGVAEQVRLFAEATHILAPHGAGLGNLVFCRPGTAVCELQMDAYVHWGFRGLAALRQLRYGCVLGAAVGARAAWVHDNVWRIDPAAVAAVLADPRFSGA